MSRSNQYAQEMPDRTPRILAELNAHADQGLPFISLEYADDYEEETMGGISTIPSYEQIEYLNIGGINALGPEAWRHLLSIAVSVTGLTFGTGGPGVSIRTADGRNVSVVPVTREEAYKPLNEIERKIFETDMGKTNKMEPIGEVLEAFGVEPKPQDEL
jgi:hypothetical protein